jgi:DNA-directed RNA polymerase subunit K/omega
VREFWSMPEAEKTPSKKQPGASAAKASKAKATKPKVVKGVLATLGAPRPGPSKRRAPEEVTSGLIGPSHLTRFERARILGARALQLSFGAPPLIELSAGLNNAMDIARAELETGALPISIRRTLPSGQYQNIPISDLLK